MKLDKTFEEIILQNKSLTDSKYVVARNYLTLRLNNDKELSKLKTIHSKQKSELSYCIKQIKNISIQKIDFNICLYKENIKDNNIDEISDKTFKSLISSFEYNCDTHYIINKDIILNYIKSLFKIKIEVINLNKGLTLKLNNFIKDNNINKYNLVKLVSLYQEVKRNISVYKNSCDTLNDFKLYQSEKDELSIISEELFLTEVKYINSKRDLDKIVNETNEQKDLDYKRKIAKHYTPRIGNNSKEFVVETLLSTKNTKNTNEEDEVETDVECMLLNNKETNNLVSEYCETSKKEVKVKEKTKEELAELKRKQKLYKEVMKEMGFY